MSKRRYASGAHSEARFEFDADGVAGPEKPSRGTIRLAWMLLRLLREMNVDYASYEREFALSRKSFTRDTAALNTVGSTHGFSVTASRHGTLYLFGASDVRGRRPLSPATADVLHAVADALGAVVSNDIHRVLTAQTAPVTDGFLHIALPRLISGTPTAKHFDDLRSAWTAGARVRFRYPKAVASRDAIGHEERTVEPHLVTYNEGRYYLVAFDARPKTNAWRQFALDRIDGPVVRAGTFKRRAVPPQYSGEDAVGLFKTGHTHRVTIGMSALIAKAVTAREWQRGQSSETLADGSARLSFDVHDLGEAVRWAFGFGTEAMVEGPPAAVALAVRTLGEMRVAYVPFEDAENVERSQRRTA